MFATYIPEGEYKEAMLARSSMSCEENIITVNQETFLHDARDVYSKTIENVGCLIGGKCPVNQNISSFTGIPFLGCFSHKFNLALEGWISVQPHLPDALRRLCDLMSLLRIVNHSAKISDITRLGAFLANKTRLKGNFCIVRS